MKTFWLYLTWWGIHYARNRDYHLSDPAIARLFPNGYTFWIRTPLITICKYKLARVPERIVLFTGWSVAIPGLSTSNTKYTWRWNSDGNSVPLEGIQVEP